MDDRNLLPEDMKAGAPEAYATYMANDPETDAHGAVVLRPGSLVFSHVQSPMQQAENLQNHTPVTPANTSMDTTNRPSSFLGINLDGASDAGPSNRNGGSRAMAGPMISKKAGARLREVAKSSSAVFNELGYIVRVDAPGRQPLSTMYLLGAKTTTDKYFPGTHGPQIAVCPVAPEADEFQPLDDGATRDYIEVGLVNGDEPDEGSSQKAAPDDEAERNMHLAETKNKKAPKKKKADAKGKQVAVTETEQYAKARPRGTNMMRVFVLRSDFIPGTSRKDEGSQAKFFAGCLPSGGRLTPRRVQAQQVFFYSEIWDAADKAFGSPVFQANKVNRVKYLNIACKMLAAYNQQQAPTTRVQVIASAIEDVLCSHPAAATPDQTLASKLIMQFRLYEASKDEGYLKAMVDAINSVEADCRFAPTTTTDGINAFMDFSKPLSKASADSLVQELKTARTSCHMRPSRELIQDIHKVLRMPAPGSTGLVGDQLPFDGICFFIETCESQRGALGDQWVQLALAMTNIHVKHSEAGGFNSQTVDEEGSEDMVIGDNDYQDVREFLQGVSGYLQRVQSVASTNLEAVLEQTGGILKETSWTDLMNKVGATIDVESFKLRFMECSAFNAALLTQKHRESVAPLGTLINLVNTYIEVRFNRDESVDAETQDYDDETNAMDTDHDN